MYIDSHCHLQDTFNLQQLTEFLKDPSNNIKYLINISTNIDEILSSRILPADRRILHSYGLYPDNAEDFDEKMREEFRKLLSQNRPIALGEVGLDYYRMPTSPVKQQKLFADQIQAAIDQNLPLIIHSREAFDDTLRIIMEYRPPIPVIFHCFGYGPTEAETLIANGYIISFAGNLTYPNAKPLHEAARIVPLNQLLLETDSPYLSPVPYRGKRNHPANIGYTYKFLAELRQIEVSKLSDIIETTFRSIFINHTPLKSVN